MKSGRVKRNRWNRGFPKCWRHQELRENIHRNYVRF